MSDQKTLIRFYTIADFKEEEQWLETQHRQGWKLVTIIPPCIYRFEKCNPEDVRYRLDYKNNKENQDYMQMMTDYGWEYFGRCVGWLYFRKSGSDVSYENAGKYSCL